MEIKNIKGKEYIEIDEVLTAIRDAPEVDYVGEYLIKLIKDSLSKPTRK